MGQLKAFLLAHAEKILLAIVVVIAFWSISSNMFSDTDEKINLGDIDRDIAKIENHLRKDQESMEAINFEKKSALVKETLNAFEKETWRLQGWDSPLYVTPPPRRKPPILIERDDMSAPPAGYISKVDMPANVQVKAGAGRIAIIFQEGPLTQWCEGALARIYRKTVGVGRQDADMDKVYQLQRERAGEQPSAYETGAGGYNPSNPGGMSGADAPPGMRYNPEAGPYFGGGRMPGQNQPGEMGTTRQPQTDYQTEQNLEEMRSEIRLEAETIAKQEAAADKDLEMLLDKEVKSEGKWERVAKDLEGIDQKPNIDLILGEKALPAPMPGVEASGQKWFYFLDKNVKENTIYRYRVLIYAKPKNLPEEILENAIETAKKKAEKEGRKIAPDPYGYYRPILRMGNLRLALPIKGFVTQMKAEKISDSAEASPLKFQELEYQREIVKDWEGNKINWWSLPIIGADATADEIWQDLSNKTSFSQFAWSDYVLTPISTGFELKSIMMDKCGIEVKIVDSTGKIRKHTFYINLPKIPADAHSLYLDTEDQIAMNKIYKSVVPAPIGQEKSLGSNTYDFSTGWGLVDIRKSRITIGKFAWLDPINRTKQPSGVMLDDPKYQDIDYMVIRELKGRGNLPPRYKVQIKYKRLAERSDYYQEITKVDWNLGIEKP